MRFDLSDEDWALLEPLLPKSRKSAGVDDRKIMNAIFCVLIPARFRVSMQPFGGSRSIVRARQLAAGTRT
jgi:transposase